MISRLSLLHSLPRLASAMPFLCWMFAQCECPAIGCLLQRLTVRRDRRERSLTRSLRSRRTGLFVTHPLQLTLHFRGPGVGAGAAVGGVKLSGRGPGRGGPVGLPLPGAHIAQMVPD